MSDMRGDGFRGTVLDFCLSRANPRLVPAAVIGWAIGGPEPVRRTAEANWLAVVASRSAAAASTLARVIARTPGHRDAVTSLGGLVSLTEVGSDPARLAAIWQTVAPAWTDAQAAPLSAGSFPLYALGVDLLLRIDPGRAEQSIRQTYLPFFWSAERLDRRDRPPVLFWHVPKTGGTSVSTAIARSLYRSGMSLVPSYTSAAFLRWLVLHQDGAFPYLSSAHLSAGDLGVQDASGYVEILVKRDPVQRALSAWRQYRGGPERRLRVLPQHGAIWALLPICDLAEWVARAPGRVICPVSWTFGGDRARAAGVTHRIALERLDEHGPDLARELGLPEGDRAMRTSKNVTRKDILPDARHLEALRTACRADLAFVAALA
jgi:hypothetical protein